MQNLNTFENSYEGNSWDWNIISNNLIQVIYPKKTKMIKLYCLPQY